MKMRFSIVTSLAVLLFVAPELRAQVRPDDGRPSPPPTANDRQGDDESLQVITPDSRFDSPAKNELFEDSLQLLREMKRVKSRHYDNDEKSDDDWFIVGGALRHQRTGHVEYNFAAFQGVENVASRIVEFQFDSTRDSNLAAEWKVFERAGNSEVAGERADKLYKQFQRFAAAQIKKQQKQSRPLRPRRRC